MTKENEIFSGHGSLQKQTLGHTQNMLMMNGPKRNVIYIGTESQIVNQATNFTVIYLKYMSAAQSKIDLSD